MKIGFDIDDTLNNIRYTFLTLLNKRFHVNVTKQQLDQDRSFYVGDTFRSLGITEIPHQDLWNEYNDELLETTLPLPFAMESLRQLQDKGHEIYYVSSRPEYYRKLTYLWLKWYGFPVEPDRLFVGMADLEKVNIIKQQGIEIFFDDKPTIIESVVQAGIRGIVKDQCYNQQWKDGRIGMWADLVPLIEQIEKENSL